MERSLIQDAERIEEMTEGRIPFDRACWIALYIQRITSGMSHEDAIRLEEEEHAERGEPSPYNQQRAQAYLTANPASNIAEALEITKAPRGWDHVDA